MRLTRKKFGFSLFRYSVVYPTSLEILQMQNITKHYCHIQKKRLSVIRYRTFNCWLLRRIFSFLRCFKAIFSESTYKTVFKQITREKYRKSNYDEFYWPPISVWHEFFLPAWVYKSQQTKTQSNTTQNYYRAAQEVAMFSSQTVLKSTKNSIRRFICFISSHWTSLGNNT